MSHKQMTPFVNVFTLAAASFSELDKFSSLLLRKLE